MQLDNVILYNDAESFISNKNNKSFGNEIYIHIQQNGSKKVTIINGLEKEDDELKKIASKLRTHFCCSCSVKKYTSGENEGMKYLKMSGEHRKDLKEYLLHKGYISSDDKVTIHG
jgi:translation initiation factor 1 (eIF-1/SUI1)